MSDYREEYRPNSSYRSKPTSRPQSAPRRSSSSSLLRGITPIEPSTGFFAAQGSKAPKMPSSPRWKTGDYFGRNLYEIGGTPGPGAYSPAVAPTLAYSASHSRAQQRVHGEATPVFDRRASHSTVISRAARFPRQQVGGKDLLEAESVPGPGEYTPRRVSRPVTAGVGMTKAARFTSFDNYTPGWLKSNDTPGPGAYTPTFSRVILPARK
eukprot:TRINITY_DN3855_c0_g3_i1.p1 TRINITY_DN3855_c0_g3~~TRINITY_DN3855_c0_g3_i1.p1  ORF type:complete len:210 (+),score=27.10 TRINITY_DN3855_c0_g3_i1:104-733(+)